MAAQAWKTGSKPVIPFVGDLRSPLKSSEIRPSSSLARGDETDLYRLSLLQQGDSLSIGF